MSENQICVKLPLNKVNKINRNGRQYSRRLYLDSMEQILLNSKIFKPLVIMPRQYGRDCITLLLQKIEQARKLIDLYDYIENNRKYKSIQSVDKKEIKEIRFSNNIATEIYKSKYLLKLNK